MGHRYTGCPENTGADINNVYVTLHKMRRITVPATSMHSSLSPAPRALGQFRSIKPPDMPTDNETITTTRLGLKQQINISVSLSLLVSVAKFSVRKRFSGQARVFSRHDAFPDTPYKCVLQGRDSHARETKGGRNRRRGRTERGTDEEGEGKAGVRSGYNWRGGARG